MSDYRWAWSLLLLIANTGAAIGYAVSSRGAYSVWIELLWTVGAVIAAFKFVARLTRAQPDLITLQLGTPVRIMAPMRIASAGCLALGALILLLQ